MKRLYSKYLLLFLFAVLTGVAAPLAVLTTTSAPAYGFFQPYVVPQQTAFGETLTGQLTPQFQGSFDYTVGNTDLNINTTENGGTVTQASAMAVLTTTATTASTALLESVQSAKYRSGLGGLSRFTALFSTATAGTEQYVGIMDEAGSSEAFNNGFGFGYNGISFGIHRWSNDTLSTVSQANWNIDTLGAGVLNPSGMTLHHTNLNVYQIRYQYLGSGAIKYYVEDDLTGEFILVHIIRYTNNFTEPSVFNPNFHHTMWVNNGATIANIIIKSSSYAYFIEGRTSFMELHQPENSSGVITTATVTTEVALLTIRNKAAYASKTNFIEIVLFRTSASIEADAANNLGAIRVVKNATLGGVPSFSDINTSNSVMEIDTSGTTVTGGKELCASLLAGKNDSVLVQLIENTLILAPGDSITIAGSSVNSATMKSLISWRELF